MNRIAAALAFACVAVALPALAQDQTTDTNGQIAPPPTPPPTPTETAATVPVTTAASGQIDNGFVLEVDIGTQLLSIGGTALEALSGTFFVGYKLDRLIFGAGLFFARIHSSGGGGGGDNSTTPFLFQPGIRYTFVQSDDRRVELFGQVDVGIGHTFTEPGDSNNITLRYDLGPGVRFWAHPQFAVGALTGLAGNFTWTNGPWGMTDVHSVFAALQLMGVF